MPKYFLECATVTLGIVSIVTGIGWYNSYRKCLDLKNSEDIIKRQLPGIEGNLNEGEHYVQQVDGEIQQLNQRIERLRNKNLKHKDVSILQRKLNSICQQVVQLRFILSNRDETIMRLNQELETMRCRINRLPEKVDLTNTLTVLNYVDNERHDHIDIGPIIPPMNEVMVFLDNVAFSYFRNHGVAMADRSEEKLFERVPKIFDIFQGIIGDCYFLSALGSIVSRCPEYVQSILIDNGDGTVTGRLFGDNNNACYYRIKKTVPVHVGAYEYLWVKMFEKLYVAHIHHLMDENNPVLMYDLIDATYQGMTFKNAYYSHNAMAHILGQENHGLIENRRYGNVRLLVDKRDLRNRKVGSYSERSMEIFYNIRERLKRQVLTVSRKMEEGAPILGGHSYSILGVKEGVKTQSGKSINLIVLRNPHGQTIPFYDTNEDGNYVLTGRNEKANEGIFSVDLNDFLRNFTSIHFCDLPVELTN